MCDRPYIITTCTFKGKDYVIKMNVINRHTLELRVSEKMTSEEWHCSYDATYIENLTHKTGNFKQFDIFVTMLKSGLLKTSDSVILDLLTFDDLEILRSRRVVGRNFVPQASHLLPANTNNRRYLILTYTVEFDRIHYPLPLEYCGPPDPQILQATIKRLELEIHHLQDQLATSGSVNRDEVIEQISALEKRLLDVTTENQVLSNENQSLIDEVNRLTRLSISKQTSQQQMNFLRSTIQTLEDKVKNERASLLNLVKKLRQEKVQLSMQLEESHRLVKSLTCQINLIPSQNLFKKQTRDVSPQPRIREISPRSKNFQQPVERKLVKTAMSEAVLGRKQSFRSNSSDSSVGNNDRGRCRIKSYSNINAVATRYRSSSGNSQKSGKSNLKPNKTTLLNNLHGRMTRSPSPCSSDASQKPKSTRRRTHKVRRERKPGMGDLEERILTLQDVLRYGMSLA